MVSRKTDRQVNLSLCRLLFLCACAAAKPASKMKSIARSITLSQNASISSLFKGDASRLHTMLQALDVKSTFPWFHASLENTPGGGLEADMSARDAGIFIMERERLLCFKVCVFVRVCVCVCVRVCAAQVCIYYSFSYFSYIQVELLINTHAMPS